MPAAALPSSPWQVARRPRWIAALAFALACAAVFALLGQWQLKSGIAGIVPDTRPTETVLPIEEVATPGSPVPTALVGQRLRVTARLAPTDVTVLSNRVNGGQTGYWVVGHLITAQGPSLAVALGWAPTREQARAAAASLAGGIPQSTFTGRYLPSEAPQEDEFERGQQSRMSVAALINQWNEEPFPVYAGYLVAATAPGGLAAIDSPPPISDRQLNWLNLFYAIEWALFAYFAVFLWWRLVRDAFEAELEEAAEAAAAPVPAEKTSPGTKLN